MQELKEVVYAAWVEPARGMKLKSGCSLHLNETDYHAFADDYAKLCDGSIVNFMPEGGPRKAHVTPALYELIEKQSNGLRLYQVQTEKALALRDLVMGLEQKLRR